MIHLIAAAVFAALSLSTAYSATPIEEALDIQEIATSQDDLGRAVVRWRDLRSREETQARYDRNGKLELLEKYSPGGALLEREDFSGGRYLLERFNLDETEQARRFELHHLSGGRFKVRVNEEPPFELGPEAAACEPARVDPIAFGKELARDVPMVTTAVQLETERSGYERRGFNIEIDRACNKNYQTRGGRKGIDGLADDFQTALNVGLRCLGRLGDFYPRATAAQKQRLKGLRDDAIKLHALFRPTNKPFTIRCDSSWNSGWNLLEKGHLKLHGLIDEKTYQAAPMRALLCTDEASDAPGLSINMSQAGNLRNPKNVIPWLFHEVLHQREKYMHRPPNEGFDVVFHVEECCFNDYETGPFNDLSHSDRPIPKNAKAACDLLTEKSHWDKLR